MKRFILFLAVLFSLAAPTVPTLAFSSLDNACKVAGANSPGTSAACSKQSEPISGSSGVLVRATNFIAVLAGAIAVIIIVVSGLFFVTAEGDASKAASARNTLIGALVGLVIVVTARSIINFVISRL